MKLVRLVVFFAPLTIFGALWAAEIRVPNDNLKSVVIEGVIVPGDFQKLHNALEKRGPIPAEVVLYSPGGDAREAMRMGAMIRELQLSTRSPHFDFRRSKYGDDLEFFEDCSDRPYTPKPNQQQNCICASACFLIWAAGIERLGDLTRVHRPRFEEQFFASLGRSEAEDIYNKMLEDIQAYLVAMHIPDETIEIMLKTASYDSAQSIARPEIRKLPYLDELLAAKCGALSKEEKGALAVAESRIHDGRDSAEDRAAYAELGPKSEEIMKCVIRQQIGFRIAAFSEYFGRDYLSEIRSGKLK